jgi:hypothetical protein
MAPYAHRYPDGSVVNFLTVADDTGTLHILQLPKHLCESTEEDVSGARLQSSVFMRCMERL